MLVCRETDSLGCVNCVEKGWNKMENKVTVVLADANEEFRTMLRQRMEGTGEFHVAGSTENGDQALDLVRRLRLLVTDVVLPGLDGFGLLRQLNQLGQGAPRTIVVSSFCSRRTVAQAMEMGVYFFLPKPVNEESLLELMRQAAAPGGGSLCPSSGGDGDRHHSRDRRPGTHQGIPVPTGGHHDRGE